MIFYRATELRAPGPDDPVAHPDEDESIEVGLFPAAEVRAMVRGGEIADLKTIGGLWLAGS